jgi:hypothetical protein
MNIDPPVEFGWMLVWIEQLHRYQDASYSL